MRYANPQIIGARPTQAQLDAMRASAAATANASGQLSRVAEKRALAAELAQRGELTQARALLDALQKNTSTAAQLALTRADVADVQRGQAPLAQRLADGGAGSTDYTPEGDYPMAQQTPTLIDAPMTLSREILGIPRTTVAAGATVRVEVNPQKFQKCDRLIVPSTIAPFFQVDDLDIGKDSQFTSSDGAPAEAFSEVAVGVSLKGRTAGKGTTITLTVTNVSAAPQDFRACIIGLTAN